MKSGITKLAAVLAIIIAVFIGFSHFGGSVDIVAPAYALEQTITVNQSIRYFHFKYFGSSQDRENALKEAWVEYNENGSLNQVRVNYYKWGGHDLVQVWKKDHAQQWNKQLKQNIHMYENVPFCSRESCLF